MKVENLEDKHYYLLIVILSLIFFFSRIYEPSLSGDAAKYALIAKTMLKTKNFLVPQLGDTFYFKKPPFFFWILALSFKFLGISEFSARLPSAIFATLDAILIYIIGKRISNQKLIGFLASIAFIINFEVIRISSIVRFESFMLLVNLLSLLLMTYPSYLRSLLTGCLISAGLLTKGPLALLGISATIIQSITSKDLKTLKLQFFSILIAFTIFGFYLLYMANHYPIFFKDFFLNQILGRITGSLKEGHARSFFFYERVILKHFWIWNIFLFLFLFSFLRERKEFIRRTLVIADVKLWKSFLYMFLITYIPLHFVSLKFTRYSYYLYPFLCLIVSFVIVKRKFIKPIIYFSFLVSLTYTVVALSCPCKFHKDKLKDIRPLIKIGIYNFHHLKIDKNINKYTAYALLFYFDELSLTKDYKYILSYKNCTKSLLKYKSFCIIKNSTYKKGHYQ